MLKLEYILANGTPLKTPVPIDRIWGLTKNRFSFW
jgi:hypothetical protein